jgi:hypothetical protein
MLLIERFTFLEAVEDKTFVSTLAGSGYQSSTDGYGMFADLNTPYGIALDSSQKTLYATDWSGQGSIVQIDIASAYKSTLAGFMH